MSVASVRIIPGLGGSGPDHWQSHWLRLRPECRRVEQEDWDNPDPERWVAALDAAVRAAPAPVVLVAHSLGCTLVGTWAASGGAVERVGGALLVAPCDPGQTDAPETLRRFAPLPSGPLPFRSTVVASSNDRYATLDRARSFADEWGSAFIDAGPIGHINAQSRLGDWAFGQVLLDTLIASVDADRTPYYRAAALRTARPLGLNLQG